MISAAGTPRSMWFVVLSLGIHIVKHLDVVGLIIKGDKCADNALKDRPEHEGKEEGQIHDVAADGRRQKNEGQTVPIKTAGTEV